DLDLAKDSELQYLAKDGVAGRRHIEVQDQALVGDDFRVPKNHVGGQALLAAGAAGGEVANKFRLQTAFKSQVDKWLLAQQHVVAQVIAQRLALGILNAGQSYQCSLDSLRLVLV